jgi:hypothetical protein
MKLSISKMIDLSMPPERILPTNRSAGGVDKSANQYPELKYLYLHNKLH